VIAATSVLALCFAAWQIRRARKQTQIQHLLQLDHEFSTNPLIEYRFALAKKRLENRNDDPFELYRLLDFFETIGLLVRRGFLDPHDVWNTFGYWILNLYKDAEDLIRELREDDPATYKDLLCLLEKNRKGRGRSVGISLKRRRTGLLARRVRNKTRQRAPAETEGAARSTRKVSKEFRSETVPF